MTRGSSGLVALDVQKEGSVISDLKFSRLQNSDPYTEGDAAKNDKGVKRSQNFDDIIYGSSHSLRHSLPFRPDVLPSFRADEHTMVAGRPRPRRGLRGQSCKIKATWEE